MTAHTPFQWSRPIQPRWQRKRRNPWKASETEPVVVSGITNIFEQNPGPKIRRLLHYWVKIKASGKMPTREIIDVFQVSGLLPYVWLIDVVRTPRIRFRFGLIKTHMHRAHAIEPVARYVDDMEPKTDTRMLCDYFHRVASEERPLFRRGRPLAPWRSGLNASGTMNMLTDKGERGEYKIPHVIYVDAYFSETVAYADLVLPDTTYLERWDCISLLDRPISNADGPADAIRQPVLKPDRDVRPFQDVLIDLGVRLKLPAFANADGSPRYPGGYADYIVNHERRPGIGSLAGWRGIDGDKTGKGEPNIEQLERYVENGCFWRHELPRDQRYYKHANKGYLETAVRLGFLDKPEPVILQLYSEPLQKFRLAARGHGAVQPPDAMRPRIDAYFDPLPLWYEPFETAALGADVDGFPLHAVTQRPMPMYHSWGSQNAWLRQILTANRLYMNRDTARSLGLADDDWVWVTSHHGRITCQVKLMAGVQADTVWTWNAIGKRAGAWNLAPDAPEATRGFLLNHLIAELLPERGGQRYANSDPVTGQAAWYDLRVRIEKAADAETGEAAPQFATLRAPPNLPPRPDILRYGADLND